VTADSNVDLPLDVGPFFSFTKLADQFFKQLGEGWGVLEPRQEIEGLAEVATMVEATSDRRQVRRPARADRGDRQELSLRLIRIVAASAMSGCRAATGQVAGRSALLHGLIDTASGSHPKGARKKEADDGHGARLMRETANDERGCPDESEGVETDSVANNPSS